jgi:hypothetical protein
VNPITWLRGHPRAAVAGGIGVALCAGFGAGRYSAPTKVVETERVIERQVIDEKYTASKVAEARTTWEREVVDHTRVVTKYLEGKVVERVEYRDRDTSSSGGTVTVRTEYVDRIVKVEVEKEVVKERLVERDCPRVAVFGTVGLPFSASGTAPLQFGATVTARVLGPLSAVVAGAGGIAGGTVTGGVGLAF